MTTSSPAFRVCAFGLTDKGQVRPSNEDHFLVADLSRTLRIQQTSLPQAATFQGRSRGHILLVADGMGGHAAGEVASALTVETVEAFVMELLRRFSNLQASDEHGVISDLRQAVYQADARIVEEVASHPELAGMGTTLVMAFTSGSRLFVIHAGDSRGYLFRGGEIHRLTEDHTVVAEMVGRGEISAEQARHHPHRHVVTNVLGGGHAGVHVAVQRVSVEPGDMLLLCSDGLTDMLDDHRIAEILAAEAEPEAACRQLVAQANEAGGQDNITAVVARFEAGREGEAPAEPVARGGPGNDPSTQP
jgi:protein phosphatase